MLFFSFEIFNFYLYYCVGLFLFPFYRYYLSVKATIITFSSLLSFLFVVLLVEFSSFVFYEKCEYVDFLAVSHEFGTIDVALSFTLSSLSYLFLLLVVAIGLATNLYTLNYFKGEADESLFLFWLNAFIASMSLLVLSNNFYTFFLGWELIGLTSFFLINFWVARRATLKSSFKALSFNLVSDLALLIGFTNLYLCYGTTDITLLVNLIELTTSANSIYLQNSSAALLLCASIKSVQLGGHLWLPDSMEAPIPASALIHSATLVSAGVYILLKFFNLFLIVNYLNYISCLGALTCAYGGVVAASQTDLKKLLAYSTMSHCGFLFLLVSFGFFFPTILYLFLHGIFKAITFFCVGSFVRVFKSQDMRLMGGAAKVLPVDSVLLIICAVNLGGLPFTLGYLYKFFFFKTFFLMQHFFLTFGFIIIGLLVSVIYVYKLIYYPVFDYLKGSLLRLLLNLKSTKFNISTYYSCYTPITFYTVIALLSLSLFVYFLAFYFLTFLAFDSISLSDWYTSFTLLYHYYTLLYFPYILLFYFIYALILFYLFIVEGRVKFTKLKSFYTLSFIISNFFILSFIF